MTRTVVDLQAEAPRPSPAAGASGAVHPDIQGLRAIAVASVVVFHLWPELLPGGFTGVDVFFVVSGFLITGRILRDLERRSVGSFVAHFWAARIRRILPAALLVIAVVLVATWLVVPESRWAVIGQHGFMSALSLENWQLAREAVDYAAEGEAPTPLQHYWSLSVEEQFYLGWPLILLAAALLGRTFGRRRMIGTAMVIVALAGLAYSLWITAADPAAAYFVTPARIWQLAAGGLLAFAGVRGVRYAPWLGVLIIAVGFAVIDVDTAYPGWPALLPTVGACLVLIGGRTSERSFDKLTDVPPIQWLGDVSYSLYLWHWPVIVLAPFVLNHEVTVPESLGLLALMLVLSELSYRFVEQPFRNGPLLKRPRRAWAIAGLVILFVCAGSFVTERTGALRTTAASIDFKNDVQRGGECVAAAAIANDCAEPFAEVTSAAALAGSSDGIWNEKFPRCSESEGAHTKKLCHFGNPSADKTVLLWGNSHAAAWSPAFARASEGMGVHGVVAARSGCPVSLGEPTEGERSKHSPERLANCLARNRWVAETVVPKADLVVLADLRSGAVEDTDRIPGMVAAIKGIREAGAVPVWLTDVPLTDSLHTRRDGPDCLALYGQCTNERDRALRDNVVLERVLKEVPDLRVIDTSDRFCDDEQCYSGVGGVSVYFDGTHLSHTYARSLGPWLAAELEACEKSARACRWE